MSKYGALDRFLHRIALGSEGVRELSFTIDQFAFGKKGETTARDAPVYICGLARAGTSILLRTLYGGGGFATLSYRDMPFVLAPRLWNRIAENFQVAGEAVPRAHQDGLLVSFDSPEAFEEVFWLTFCGEDYIKPAKLTTHHVSDEVLTSYRNYTAAIVGSRSPDLSLRYLCKNNNNILRIDALVRAFPAARILIAFRDPLQHAVSLFRQHGNFCRRQSDDRFIASYMNWLGHHEFGLNHRAFDLGDNEAVRLPDDTACLDYWLAMWTNVYSHLISLAGENLRFICYETLCDRPAATLGAIARELGCAEGHFAASAGDLKKASEHMVYGLRSPDLLKTARRVHECLCERALV